MTDSKNSDELLKTLMESFLCSKCHKPFGKDKRVLKIQTSAKQDFHFCVPCTKEAFHTLNSKKNKTIEEVNLLVGMREFLQKVNRIHES